MACSSLVALPRTCGAEGVLGGVDKLYVIAFTDLTPIDAQTSDAVFTTATSGIVSAIGVADDKAFVEIGLLKANAAIDEALTKDSTKGVSFVKHTLKFSLSDMTIDNRNWVMSVLNQPVSVLIKTRTGKTYAAGLNGRMEMSALEGGSGTAEGDFMGYALTFEGTDSSLIPQVDPTIIQALIS